jgi:molybdopterin-binding protein
MIALYRLEKVLVRRQGRAILNIETQEIAAGGITALVGPNGAGKSTLLELLAFLSTHDTGDIYFRGEKVVLSHDAGPQRKVGLVPQHPFLFNRSVRGNVELALQLQGHSKKLTRCRAEIALDRFGLMPLASRHVRALSGGEAQKLAIARTMALEPEVLLLDEPFSSLDAHATDDLAQLMATLPSRKTGKIIFSTHDQILASLLAQQVIGVIGGHTQEGVLLNHYTGHLVPRQHTFDTGRLLVQVADQVTHGSRIVIDPAHVVLSARRLESSMRNEFRGRVTALAEQGGEVRVTIDAGEILHALVTHETVHALGLQPGGVAWVGFKANAVRVY